MFHLQRADKNVFVSTSCSLHLVLFLLCSASLPSHLSNGVKAAYKSYGTPHARRWHAARRKEDAFLLILNQLFSCLGLTLDRNHTFAEKPEFPLQKHIDFSNVQGKNTHLSTLSQVVTRFRPRSKQIYQGLAVTLTPSHQRGITPTRWPLVFTSLPPSVYCPPSLWLLRSPPTPVTLN